MNTNPEIEHILIILLTVERILEYTLPLIKKIVSGILTIIKGGTPPES